MPQKLTATLIKRLKPRDNRYIITDSQTAGLAVVVSPNGSKYFYYRYRPSGGRAIVEEPIGNAGNLSLADARKAVSIKAGEVAKGVDSDDVLLHLMDNCPNYLPNKPLLVKMAAYLAEKREGLKSSRTFNPAEEASNARILAEAISNQRL